MQSEVRRDAMSPSCSTASWPCSRRLLQHSGAVLVDATLGLGGHSEAFLERCPEAHLIGLDRDPEALRLAA